MRRDEAEHDMHKGTMESMRWAEKETARQVALEKEQAWISYMSIKARA